jgi:hypothetical protein
LSIERLKYFNLWRISLKKPYYIKPEDQELNRVLAEEKNLTSSFYARMSGQVQWSPGERTRFEDKFSDLAIVIKNLQGQKAAEEFASLPQGDI